MIDEGNKVFIQRTKTLNKNTDLQSLHTQIELNMIEKVLLQSPLEVLCIVGIIYIHAKYQNEMEHQREIKYQTRGQNANYLKATMT